jgi:hypothetical protein
MPQLDGAASRHHRSACKRTSFLAVHMHVSVNVIRGSRCTFVHLFMFTRRAGTTVDVQAMQMQVVPLLPGDQM